MGSNNDVFSMSALTAALNAGYKADLINAVKNKLQDLTRKQSPVMKRLAPIIRDRVDALREIQIQHDEYEAKFLEERAALEAKYQKLYQPLYTKRYEIINGELELSDAKTEEADKEDKGVPGFWLNALKNNDVIGEEISEPDEEVLTYLKDIKWSRNDDPKGFKLEFFFETNPYFKNSVLTKTYHMIDEDEPMMERAIGTEIEWYPGKCLTPETLEKKAKGSKNADPITKTEHWESFFNFFSPPEVPADNGVMLRQDATDELQNLTEMDYDVGSTIRDKIIPHAVSWFTGEALPDGYDFYDDEDEDEDDYEFFNYDDDDEEDYDDDDDDDDDEEEEEEDSGKTKTEKRVPDGDGPQGERPLECKNQ